MTEDKSKDAAAETEVKEEEAPATEEAKVEEKAEEAAPVEEKKEEAAEEPKEVPAEYKKMIEQIESMTVLELNGLVKAIEERFGVSAAAVAVAGGGAGDASAAEEKSDFEVNLVSFGEKKIAVIKAIKTLMGLGLKEAKDLVESAPTALKSEVPAKDAEEWKTALEEAGATVELK